MPADVAARTFRVTLDLFDGGVQLMRQNLRRSNPDADEQEITRRLSTWLRERPGAEHGDCPGRAVDNRVTSLESVLQRIAADLERSGVDFALVGGLAVSVRTEPRFTRDADFAVAVESDADAKTLIRHLRTGGYEVEALVEQEAVSRLATVRLTVGGDATGPVVDLLFASSGIEVEVVAAAEPIQLLPGLTLKVARIEHLIALKVLSRDDTRRPQDLVDLRALLRTATRANVTSARAALALITARGYHRGRELLAQLEALQRQSS